ncbi:metallophosphoesterase [Sphingomonas sp. CV7422]|uniref:metallophosphoesterase n=1 Tax=Sphingomonas sp. CV7422 TaxID=3018036 RepID=UPI0022FEBDFB|nr:metallophosphoesterase [Sphingomonas sp. CV7422]
MIAIRRVAHNPAPGLRAGPQPLYAIGDVHGRYDLLHALLAEISRDAAERHPGVTPRLLLCGDYVDRGPASAAVLAALVWLLRSKAVDARLLEGNHEAMLRGFLDRPAEHRRWLAVGGAATIASYGVAIPDEAALDTPATLVALRDSLLDAMPTSHYHLLDRLDLLVEVGDYAFVHAGVVPGVALHAQRRDDLLWIRDEFLDHPRPATAVIVHGHTWTGDQPVLLPHRIGIDTGAYKTGVLTALYLCDDRAAILQAVDTPAAEVNSAS